MGVNIVKRCLEEPLRRIATNAGIDGSIALQEVRNSKGNVGLNAATGNLRGTC